MSKVFFIGRFPPPYGGATIKSKILYNMLKEEFEVDKFDTELKNKNKLLFSFKLIEFILKNKKNYGVICIASVSLFKLTKIISIINKRMLERISVFAIGGALDEMILLNNISVDLLKKYKVIYVECNGCKDKLNKMGLNNVEVIPNFRVKPEKREFRLNTNEGLRCVFISRIDRSKGVNKIIDAFRELDNKYNIDFYGPIEKSIELEFIKNINELNNANYKGIINSSDNKIYDLISSYDLLIFPSEWKGEGYPGIIAEAKIAGIPIISSNFKYAKEIIMHYKDGIIMKNNTVDELRSLLIELQENKKLLNSIRIESFKSGEKCIIDNYKEIIIGRINKEGK